MSEKPVEAGRAVPALIASWRAKAAWFRSVGLLNDEVAWVDAAAMATFEQCANDLEAALDKLALNWNTRLTNADHFNPEELATAGDFDAGRRHELTRCIRDLDAALEAAVGARPAGWQPIETAPKDRRWVLVWQEDVGFAVYRFGPGLIGEPDDPQWTHWMPLPTPPEAPDARV